eukprot:TRINITY_DN2775_c0_g1_i1.p1 TRINITY_DN2775_c0_g1~~TRINITY_DN2775_c0_g1_i1.p1  ORF type:complete len:280 (-),score=42.18 TRINITY_DN2775_c0_g1_i1:50-889(-)
MLAETNIESGNQSSVGQEAGASVSDGYTAMEDIKENELEDDLKNAQKQLHSPELSCVRKIGTSIQLTNENFPKGEYVDSLIIAESLPEYKSIAEKFPRYKLAKKTRSSPELTLILDLDETLVFASPKPVPGYDCDITIKKRNVSFTIYLSIRPFAIQFLEFAAKYFEVIVFTASEKAYADQAIDILDPHKKLIKYRLFRSSCLEAKNAFVKDISSLGRDLSKTIIVDNAIHSFAYNLENAILIKSYEGGDSDVSLLCLMSLLQYIKDTTDVREALKQLI